MKTIKLYLATFIILIMSCKPSVDRSNIDKLGRYIYSRILEQDSGSIFNLYQDKHKPLHPSQVELLMKYMNEFSNKKSKYLTSDSSVFKLSNGYVVGRYLQVYAKVDTSYYSITCSFGYDSVNNIWLDGGIGIVDLSKRCNMDKTSLYCPSRDVKFTRINWSTDYFNKTFKKCEVEVVNDLDEDIDYIKFKIKLKNNGENFFTQTVESYEKTFSGDTKRIKISGLEDFYTGFQIEKENLSYEVDLIEVRPKKIGSECQMIIDLKAKGF